MPDILARIFRQPLDLQKSISAAEGDGFGGANLCTSRQTGPTSAWCKLFEEGREDMKKCRCLVKRKDGNEDDLGKSFRMASAAELIELSCDAAVISL